MRVIIADDELHVRRRLTEKIDWKAFGIDEIAVCSDGDEILEKIENQKADLILTDIRMPRMDGITAVRKARKLCPDLTVILMSAYDDKEYLKSALDLQVLGYLEKPFSLEQVRELVKRAAEQKKEQEAAAIAVDFAAREQRRSRLEKIGLALCQYQSSYEEYREYLVREFPEFAKASCYYAVLLRRREEELDRSPDADAVWFADALEKYGWCGICAGMKRGGVILLLAGDAFRLEWILNRFLHLPDLPGAGSWMFAAGSAATELSGIYHSYQDAVITMERHFYHCFPILYYEEKQTGPMSFGKEEQAGFQFALQSRNLGACLSYLEGLKRTVHQHDTTLVRVTKNHYFELALLILQNRTDTEQKKIQEYYLWELFYQMSSLDELHNFLVELLNDCMPENAAGAKMTEDISVILEYIDSHLQNPSLSLSDISQKHYMSVTWLCIYFKEKTGTTIKSYIIESRMKKAAQLFTYTDLKVAEVAEAVGFTDQSYFTKSFGRYFGKSPSRYKEEQHGENK